MSNAIKYSAYDAFTKVIAGTSGSDLKNLANNAAAPALSGVANNTNHMQYGDFVLKCKFGTGPSATDARVDLYLITSVDNSTYEDALTTAAPVTTYVGSFPVQNVTTQQRLGLYHILLPNCAFKPLVINRTGQSTSNVDNENELYLSAYNDEIQ